MWKNVLIIECAVGGHTFGILETCCRPCRYYAGPIRQENDAWVTIDHATSNYFRTLDEARQRFAELTKPGVVTYRLYNDDCDDLLIQGPRPIDLTAAVRETLAGLSNEDILEPAENWFTTVVLSLCERTGFNVVEESVELNVEDLYWEEHALREGDCRED